jgi:hypothetical protein
VEPAELTGEVTSAICRGASDRVQTCLGIVDLVESGPALGIEVDSRRMSGRGRVLFGGRGARHDWMAERVKEDTARHPRDVQK